MGGTPPNPPKKNDEKPWGEPPQTPPKRMTKKTWGRCPQTPTFAKGQGWGEKTIPHPKPKRICSVAVNPFNRHKKTRKGRAIYTIKGYDRTRAAVSRKRNA